MEIRTIGLNICTTRIKSGSSFSYIYVTNWYYWSNNVKTFCAFFLKIKQNDFQPDIVQLENVSKWLRENKLTLNGKKREKNVGISMRLMNYENVCSFVFNEELCKIVLGIWVLKLMKYE